MYWLLIIIRTFWILELYSGEVFFDQMEITVFAFWEVFILTIILAIISIPIKNVKEFYNMNGHNAPEDNTSIHLYSKYWFKVSNILGA